MAIVTATTNKEELRERILGAVQDMYTEVASCPTKGFHFPTGRTACEDLGYPTNELDALPPSAVESCGGGGFALAANVLHRGDVVLDVGSGAGTDVLIAAMKVGPEGKVYGLDITEAMIEKANDNIVKSKAHNVQIVEGNAEAIPLPDETFDVVTSNGVLNLAPDKEAAYREMYRILKRGGHIQISDIVLGKNLSEKSRSNPQLWAECIVGAVLEENYLNIIRTTGFTDVRVIDRIDYFEKSSHLSTQEVAKQYGAISITIVGRK
jgi:ubiquinone/menaquinone biosynthesis C-methylase UbiE